MLICFSVLEEPCRKICKKNKKLGQKVKVCLYLCIRYVLAYHAQPLGERHC